MSKKIEISEFAQRFYAVEISKTIVFLAEKHVKVLLNSEIEICIITLEILNRCDFVIKSDSSFTSLVLSKIKLFLKKGVKTQKSFSKKLSCEFLFLLLKIKIMI